MDGNRGVNAARRPAWCSEASGHDGGEYEEEEGAGRKAKTNSAMEDIEAPDLTPEGGKELCIDWEARR